jgi:hypothetical protein
MSHFGVSIYWVDRIALVKHCEHTKGTATFNLNFETNYYGNAYKPEKHTISLTANAKSVAKFERIAAAINEIMAEDDTGDGETVIAPALAAE